MNIEDIEKFVSSRDVVFLSGVDGEGFPATTAMLPPRGRNGIKSFDFSTNTSSNKVETFRRNSSACVYLCDRENYMGLKIQGRVEVTDDPVMKRKLWEEGDEAYYPLGVTDPDYIVLRFRAVKARLYNGGHNLEIALYGDVDCAD